MRIASLEWLRIAAFGGALLHSGLPNLKEQR